MPRNVRKADCHTGIARNGRLQAFVKSLNLNLNVLIAKIFNWGRKEAFKNIVF